MLTSRIDTHDSLHDLNAWSDCESMENREPESATTYEEYALHSVYAHDSDSPTEQVKVPTPEQLEAARKEINESKQRIDERLNRIKHTLTESNTLLGCTKRFADKFKKASKGGRI